MYINVVVCQHDGDPRKFLFRAPADMEFTKGDRVQVDTRYGDYPATVMDSYIVSNEDEKYRFMLRFTGATDPLKPVIGKWNYIPFD